MILDLLPFFNRLPASGFSGSERFDQQLFSEIHIEAPFDGLSENAMPSTFKFWMLGCTRKAEASPVRVLLGTRHPSNSLSGL